MSKNFKNRHINILILLVYSLTSVGCNSIKELNMVGTYKVPVKHWDSPTLVLNQDGTFEFSNHYLYSYSSQSASFELSHSDGSWESINKKEIVLNSRLQPIDKIINTHKILFCEKTNNDSLKLKLIDETNNPIPFVTIKILKEGKQIKGGLTNFQGECNFLNLEADSVKIEYLDYKEITLQYNNLKGQDCSIMMMSFPSNYKFFTNKKLKYTKTRIYYTEDMLECGLLANNFKRSYFKKKKNVP